MTQEEKAKAYDEALERAKKQLEEAKVFDYEEGQIAHDIRTTTYAIFPELKESEDERIRKELIAFLKENHETGRAEETWSLNGIERWIAYLEKQKEQKPKWSKEDENKLNHILEIVHIASGGEVNVDEKEELESFLKSLRPQTKQKWSEEDNIKIATLSEIIFDYAFHKDALDENQDLTGEYAKLYNWLESLPERFNLQPKAKQEQKDEVKLTGWVARDRNGEIWVYGAYPEKNSERQIWTESICMPLNRKSFPDLKWEDEPMEVEITIRKK